MIAKFDGDDFRLLLPQASLWSMSTIRCLGSWTNGRRWFVTEKMVVKSKGIRDPKWPKQPGLGILIWSNLPRCWRGKGRLQCGHSGKKWQKFGWWWREIPCQSQKSSGSQPVLVETGFSGPQKVGVKEDELFIQQWGQSMTAVQPAAMVILFFHSTTWRLTRNVCSYRNPYAPSMKY